MSRDPRTHSAPRARPVADIALDRLLARDREIARAWAVAMVLTRPLEELVALPLHELSAEAPALCAQALRALGSDAELDRLAAGEGAASAGRDALAGQRSLATLLGTADPPAAVAAAESLRGVLWQALLDDLSQPGPRLLADLADRLSYVCSAILAAALAPSGDGALEWEGPTIDRDAPGHRPAVMVDEFEGGAGPRHRVLPREPGAPPRRVHAPGEGERTGPPWNRPAPPIAPRPLPWDAPAGEGLRVRRSEQHHEQPLDEPA
jgi:hypothetical protein